MLGLEVVEKAHAREEEGDEEANADPPGTGINRPGHAQQHGEGRRQRPGDESRREW
jgi:hypothetical protein